jgi:hypothetical protein
MHPGLAFALVCLTFGLYTFYWFWKSWREIKQYDGDAGKRPVWHTLALAVPIYGLYRMHAHMRTIAALVRGAGGETSLSPGTAVAVWVVVHTLFRASDQPGLGWLYVVGLLLEGGLVAWAQAALNRAWCLQDPQARVRPNHPGNWLVLGVGAVLSALALIGLGV